MNHRACRNVPSVEAGAAHQTIAGGLDEPVPAEIGDVILQQDETRPPAPEIEAAQNLYFVSFNVNREKVDGRRRAGLYEDFVEGPDRNFDNGFRSGTRPH